MRIGLCEIFFMSLNDQTADTCFWNAEENEPIGEGWFYWCCSPGCLPEGDPIGPFANEVEAEADARENGYIGDSDE